MRRICQVCGRIFDSPYDAIKCPQCAEESKRQTVLPRICRSCGKTFSGGPRAWYCPDCRAERQKEQSLQYKQRKKSGSVRKLGSTDICPICGKPYVVNGGNQKYCPDCAPDAIRAIDREQSKSWNKENISPMQKRKARRDATSPKICVVCGKSFIPSLGKGKALTCSPECAALLKSSRFRAWETAHRQERNAYHRDRYKKSKALESDET